jgi:hypothetical protein
VRVDWCYVEDKTGRNTVAHIFTGQRGAYRIARLRPGTYYVRVEGHSSVPPGDQGTDGATYYGGASIWAEPSPSSWRAAAPFQTSTLRSCGAPACGYRVGS